MKQIVSSEQKQRVIDLHHRHTLRETAAMTDLPLGTVKTLCSRSGAFRDNTVHRALFTLPPVQVSAQTLPAIPDLPPQVDVTGDPEVDAVLWLRQVINTGHAALIEKAMKAAKHISTPLKVLEDRYTKYLATAHPENPFAALFGSLGFADLDGLARKAIEQERLRCEAVARFGERLFAHTDAESFCIEALEALQLDATFQFDPIEVAIRFRANPALLPNTLSDCLHELNFWDNLFRLRRAVDPSQNDCIAEADARKQLVIGLLAQRRPRTNDEALSVFRYLVASDRMNNSEADAILINLIGSGQR